MAERISVAGQQSIFHLEPETYFVGLLRGRLGRDRITLERRRPHAKVFSGPGLLC